MKKIDAEFFFDKNADVKALINVTEDTSTVIPAMSREKFIEFTESNFSEVVSVSEPTDKEIHDKSREYLEDLKTQGNYTIIEAFEVMTHFKAGYRKCIFDKAQK